VKILRLAILGVLLGACAGHKITTVYVPRDAPGTCANATPIVCPSDFFAYSKAVTGHDYSSRAQAGIQYGSFASYSIDGKWFADVLKPSIVGDVAVAGTGTQAGGLQGCGGLAIIDFLGLQVGPCFNPVTGHLEMFGGFKATSIVDRLTK